MTPDDYAIELEAAERAATAAHVAMAANLDQQFTEQETWIAGLEARQAALEARITALEGGTPPPPDPPDPMWEISGPTFNPGDPTEDGDRVDLPRDGNNEPPNFTGLYYRGGDSPGPGTVRGNAPVWREDPDSLRVRLAQADQVAAHGSGTGTHELHLPLTPTRGTVKGECDIHLVDTPNIPYDPGQTGKFWGLVGFNTRDWDQWPGGGRYGPQNFSVRVAHWWWDRKGDGTQGQPGTGTGRFGGTSWRPSLYLYHGGPHAEDPTGTTPNGDTFGPNYVSNKGHTGEWVLHHWDAPPVGRYWHTSLVAHAGTPGVADGWVQLWLDGVLACTIEQVTWCTDGPGEWTQMYGSFGHGGGVDFAPRNPDRATELTYQGLQARVL